MEQRPPEEGWNRPKPEVISGPTWWPAATAFGATLFIWGLVMSVIILGIGAIVTGVSLAGWIGEIRHEQNKFE